MGELSSNSSPSHPERARCRCRIFEAAIHEFGGAFLVAVEGAGLDAQGIQLGFGQDTGVNAGIVGKAFDEDGIFGGGFVHEFHDVDPLVES